MDYMSKPTKKQLRNQARNAQAALLTLEAANPGIDFAALHHELAVADWLAGDYLFAGNELPLSRHVFPGEVTTMSGDPKPRPS